MRIGCGNCFRIEIERPRTERANYKSVAFKGLMRRRRQVKSPDSGLKAENTERPGKVMAIPTDHVERMIGQHHLCQRVFLLHDQLEFTLFVTCFQILGKPDIPFRVRTRLSKLSILIAVTLRSSNVS